MKSDKSPYEDRVSLFIVGDVMLSRGVGTKITMTRNAKFPIEKIESFLAEADILCGNLEGPISDTGEKTGSFRAGSETIHAITKFHVMNLANNHIWDCGEQGIEETTAILQKYGIMHCGIGRNPTEAYEPAVIIRKGRKYAFFGCTEKDLISGCCNSSYHIAILENEMLGRTIKYYKDKVDFIVLVFHGGNEFIPFPQPSLRRALKKLADEGIDLIVTHHPHVLGGYEAYAERKLIWYSLGDFIFDGSITSRRKSGVLTVTTSHNGIVSFKFVPAYINDELQVELAKDKMARIILDGIENVNAKMKDLKYSNRYLIRYLNAFLQFQVERLFAYYNLYGFSFLVVFVSKRLKYTPYYISRLFKHKYR